MESERHTAQPTIQHVVRSACRTLLRRSLTIVALLPAGLLAGWAGPPKSVGTVDRSRPAVHSAAPDSFHSSNPFDPSPRVAEPIDPIEQPRRATSRSPVSTRVLSGRVVDLGGRPQADANVVALTTGTGGGDRVETTTDSSGNFRLGGLQPGRRYLVLATTVEGPEPLIGRVAAIPAGQSLLIEVARPFRASRRPFEPSNAAATAPSAEPVAPARAKTRQDLIAENRSESPWNWPSPPVRSTPTPTPTPTASSPAGSATKQQWRPASSSRNGSERAQPGRAGVQPRAAPRARPEAPTPTGPQSKASSTGNPASPHARPTGIAAAPNSTRPPTGTSSPALDRLPAEPGSVGPMPHPPAARAPAPRCAFDGERLRDFELQDLRQQPVAFSGLDGKLVLIDFWGTWCAYCLKSMPHLVELQRCYGDQGLRVVGIAYEQEKDPRARAARVQAVCQQLNVNYPILLADEAAGPCPVKAGFQVHLYPTLVLLDRSGRVLWRSEGAEPQDLQRLENVLKTQLATQPNGYNAR